MTLPARNVVRIQTVLFRTPSSTVRRLVSSVTAAARLAIEQGRIAAATWSVGDCTPTGACLEGGVDDLATAGAGVLRTVEYVPFGENLGHGGGQNRLVQAATDEDLLLFLNPDTYLAPDALVHLVDALRDPAVALAEARQLPLEHPKTYDLRTGDTEWCSGACVLARRAEFEAVGRFDDVHFPLHGDDVDLSWRLRAAGKRLVYVPDAVVFHDKLPADGVPYAGSAEEYHGVWAKLMLGSLYGDETVVRDTTLWVRAHGSRLQRQALEDFEAHVAEHGPVGPDRTRRASGRFVQGEYTEHRW